MPPTLEYRFRSFVRVPMRTPHGTILARVITRDHHRANQACARANKAERRGLRAWIERI